MLYFRLFDIKMNAIATVLLFLVGIQAVYSQGGGFGFGGGSYGYGGGFYGCSSYVPTLGYECYQPETGKNTVACLSKYFDFIIKMYTEANYKIGLKLTLLFLFLSHWVFCIRQCWIFW